MAATMASVNVVAGASTPMQRSSIGGQCLVVGRGVGVAVRRPVQVRAETNAERYARKAQNNVEQQTKQAGAEAENLGSKIAHGAENLKNKLFGAGKDAQKEAVSVGKDAQKNAGKGLGGIEGGLKGAVASVQDSLKGNAAASTGKDIEEKTGNALENLETGLKDAVKKQQEIVQAKKDEILKNKE